MKYSLRANTMGNILLETRSEITMNVASNLKSALLDFDYFIPKLIGRQGIYVTEARVKPDPNGQFYVSIINVNDNDVILRNSSTDNVGKVKFGKNLNSEEETQVVQKGRILPLLMEDSIETGDKKPAYSKPRRLPNAC